MDSAKKTFEITDRRKKVSEMYLKKMTQREIATVLGVDQKTICNDLKAIREEWTGEAIVNFNDRIQEELETLRLIEKEAWQEWDRSKEEREIRISEKTTGGKDGERTKASIRKEEKLADASFLKIIQENVKLRCDLLGLKAPTKIAPTTPDGSQPYEPRNQSNPVTSLIAEALQIINEDRKERTDQGGN